MTQRQGVTLTRPAPRSQERPPTQTAEAGPTPHAGVLRLQRAAGNRAVTTLVQAKLRIGVPAGLHELEADRVAAELTGGQAPGGSAEVSPAPRALQRCPGGCPDRPCDHRAGGAELVVQRSPTAAGAPTVGHDVERGLAALRGGGRNLAETDRRFFEQRLGMDLGGVRVHVGGEAAALSDTLQARAFTLGADIIFGAGQYAPATTQGRRLLAHELVHVVQQGAATPAGADARVGGVQPGLQLAPAVPAGTVQRQCSTLQIGAAAVRGDATTIAGELWLCLDQEQKVQLVDLALEGAAQALAKLPDDATLGVIWPLFKAGLEGFVARLRSPAVEAAEKVAAMDKIAGILAGRNAAFTLAYLKGLAKGFFLDGLLGIFILVYDLVVALRNVWSFIEQFKQAIEGLPDEVEQLVTSLKGWYETLVQQAGPALDEVRKWAADPKRVLELLSTAADAVAELVRTKAGDLAEHLVRSINKPGSEEDMGEAAGRVTGMVAWEVVFAVLTAGGGAAVTVAKAGLKTAVGLLRRLAGRVATGFLKLFAELHAVLTPVIGWVRKAVQAIKGKIVQLGEGLAGLLEKLREFVARVLRFCTESKTSCKWPKHHAFPMYLGGLINQTLKKLPRNLHKLFHRALDKWERGTLGRSINRFGLGKGIGLTFGEIVEELRLFYMTAEGGKFRRFLPDFEHALNETFAGAKIVKKK